MVMTADFIQNYVVYMTLTLVAQIVSLL